MSARNASGRPPVSPLMVLSIGVAAISTGAIFVRLADAPALATAAYRVGRRAVGIVSWIYCSMPRTIPSHRRL